MAFAQENIRDGLQGQPRPEFLKQGTEKHLCGLRCELICLSAYLW